MGNGTRDLTIEISFPCEEVTLTCLQVSRDIIRIYKNDSFESKSIECFERYNRENTFFHLIELRDRERERENSIYKYARERKKFEHSIRISIIR